MAPTVRPIADAVNDSTVTIPQNFANLKLKEKKRRKNHTLCTNETSMLLKLYAQPLKFSNLVEKLFITENLI
jgi:hypothetical protein